MAGVFKIQGISTLEKSIVTNECNYKYKRYNICTLKSKLLSFNSDSQRHWPMSSTSS